MEYNVCSPCATRGKLVGHTRTWPYPTAFPKRKYTIAQTAVRRDTKVRNWVFNPVGSVWSDSVNDLEDFWKTRLSAEKVPHIMSATSSICRRLETSGRSQYSPVEIAAHLDRIAPLMGLAPLDVAFTVERVPELMDTPPIVIVEALMTIREALPREVDPSRIVMLEPTLLTLEGVKYTIAGCLAELRWLLPEACVCWLVQEEPKVLFGLSVMRSEQLKETKEMYLECIEEIAATENAVHNHKLRMWFENVFINYYY